MIVYTHEQFHKNQFFNKKTDQRLSRTAKSIYLKKKYKTMYWNMYKNGILGWICTKFYRTSKHY